jgi:hypothetical protein
MRHLLIGLILGVSLITLILEAPHAKSADGQTDGFSITGQLIDVQGQPVVDAEVSAHLSDEIEVPLAEAESQEDGSWSLLLQAVPEGDLIISIERHHFETQTIRLGAEELDQLEETGAYTMGELRLERRISAGFWAATVIFLAVLLIIAFEKLHSTTAALAGLSVIFVATFVGVAFFPDLYIFDFERALTYMNWEVIFLVMGMMIIIAIIEGTGIFQWMAFQAYRLSRGHSWLLVLLLMLLTAVASALLDNFTTMLLMTPISLQIGLALGINPLALIIQR